MGFIAWGYIDQKIWGNKFFVTNASCMLDFIWQLVEGMVDFLNYAINFDFLHKMNNYMLTSLNNIYGEVSSVYMCI